MTTLFIAEKPDVGRALARALSPNHEEKGGYIIGENGMIITWAIGHLIEIKTPDKIDPKFKSWNVEDLPIIPDKLMLQPIDKTKGQLAIIDKLIKSGVDTIYCATDSGREGELIFYLIALYLKFTHKNIKRLWTSSIQPEAIRKAYSLAKDWDEYKNLRAAALARSQADWVIGINATRVFSCVSGQLVNIGRVLTPSTALVYDRHMERVNFKVEPYYSIGVTFQQLDQKYKGDLVLERITDKKLAENISIQIKGKPGVIKELLQEDKSIAAPSLMDLTELSKIANERFGFKAKKTLELAQTLYEKHKCITYPRTSGTAVTVEELPLMHKAFDILKEVHPALSKGGSKTLVTEQNKRVCNPANVTDHHALLPEPVIPSDLSKEESQLYSIVVERFFMQFQQSAIYTTLYINTLCEEYEFNSNFKQLKQLGWKALLPPEDNQPLPNISISDSVICSSVDVDDKKTTPPELYTDGTLMQAMQNISRRIKDPKLKNALKDQGIGTVATRPNMIDKIERSQFIQYSNKKLDITKKGITTIELLRKTKVQTLTSPEYTALWELQLEQIEKGTINARDFKEKTEQFATMIVNEAKNVSVSKEDFEETIGNCPVCNKPVRESEKRFYCTGYKEGCSFFVWKVQYKKKLTIKMLQTLLSKKKTGVLTFKSKTSTYKASLHLPNPIVDGKLVINFPK